MEYDPQDTDVIHLLKKLKDGNGTYPAEMLALRRQHYLSQVAEISGGAGLAMALKNAAKTAKTAGLPPATGTIVEALLVVALVAEAGAVSYFYRDKIAEYFQKVTNSPTVQEISSPAASHSPITEIVLTPSPVLTLTVTVTQTETLTLTPGISSTPELAAQSPEEGNNGTSSALSGNTAGPSVSTQAPKGNNGNQYGLTPKPARTKVPGNQISSTQESNNNNKKKP
jgi:hypothetical protein